MNPNPFSKLKDSVSESEEFKGARFFIPQFINSDIIANSNNINSVSEKNENEMSSSLVSWFMRIVVKYHFLVATTVVLFILFSVLLINIVNSFNHRKVTKNRKKNINYLEVIELNDI